MNVKLINNIAVICSDETVITDVRSALDLIMTVKYDSGCEKIAINKSALCDDFFVLSTGIAGEILQKFINYHVSLAVFGDFSRYSSKPLHDLFRESNRGRDVFFVSTQEDAVEKLSAL